jgi:hypothetical protein
MLIELKKINSEKYEKKIEILMNAENPHKKNFR